MDKISISQFKATCLKLLADVNRRKKPLTVTKNGKPLVVVYPAPANTVRPPFGVAKDTVTAVDDLISPVVNIESWESLK